MGFLQEFREFAVKGNAIDMAVGIIVGAAFAPIVRSLVDDVIMPPIGLIVGNVDFSHLMIVLREARTTADGTELPQVAILYGKFFNLLIAFVITTFAVFLLVKAMNRVRRREELAPVAPTDRNCPHCAMKIPVQATRCGHCTMVVEEVA